MANSKNKKIPVSAKPTGVKTGSRRVAPPPVQQPEKQPMSKQTKTVLAIIAAILVIALIVTLVFTVIIPAIQKAKITNYYNDDLSKYIDLPESVYKNIKITASMEEFSEDDIICEINKLIAAKKNTTPEWMGGGVRDLIITPGDVVSIRYRGYIIDTEGNQKDFAGGCNFSSLTASSLEIGSGSFIPGFEDALVGINPKDTPEFSKITEGNVEEGDVVYLTYTAFYPKGEDKSASYERLDLSRDDIDEEYGIGFKDFILGLTINSDENETYNVFDYGEDGDVSYTDLKVNFVTRCESEPFTISVTFPADYNEETLRGADVAFDVYIDYAVDYTIPDGTEGGKVASSLFAELYTLEDYKTKLLTDTFITKVLGKTDDYLKAGAGNTKAEKLISILEKDVRENIKTVNDKVILDGIWAHLQEKVVVKKYPEDTVQEYYDIAYAQLVNYYNSNSSSYDSLDAAAIAYLSLNKGADWQAYILDLAKSSTVDKLIFFYIIREENFIPSEKEYAEWREKTLDEEMVYWIEVYGEDLAELEGEEYDKRYAELRRLLIEYHGEEGLKDLIYSNYGEEMMIKYLPAK